ncbi:MAG: DUF2325 domain-containing protein [Methylotenera sp.]|nr:DUF2325 domain-containing protein [Methylotenera sp.]
MSSVLIVGGDHVDGIKNVLNQAGIAKTYHWSGRKAQDNHKVIPLNTRFIVMVTGFINHSFTYNIKHAANKRQLPVIYTSSNAQKLQIKIEQFGGLLSSVDDCRKTLLNKIWSVLMKQNIVTIIALIAITFALASEMKANEIKTAQSTKQDWESVYALNYYLFEHF